MCGIFLLLIKNSSSLTFDDGEKLFNTLSKRANQTTLHRTKNMLLGFHRLPINDLTNNGNQPFYDKHNNFLVCNGEIYNHKFLEDKYNISPTSSSDCECLLPLIRDNGLKVIEEIDGVFAIITKINNNYYFIRDRIGVKPLFMIEDDNFIAVASEPIALEFKTQSTTSEILPSTIVEYDNKLNYVNTKLYYDVPSPIEILKTEWDNIIPRVRYLLEKSVKKRMISDRPIGCLLSGGLDSSIIAALLSKYYKNSGRKLKTFSIGFEGSSDIKYARLLSQHIDSDHQEIIIDYQDAINKIPQVIENLATYDITTIRASTPMWILCEHIKKNYEETVLFSGEGSDEVFSGYLYFHCAPTPQDLSRESSRLVKELYKYDVLRADRCVSDNALDLREPFLDIDLIDYYLTLPSKYRTPVDGYEKWVLRKAFEDILPPEIAWRRKTAFSDGVTSSEKPWYRYIQDWSDKNIELTRDFKTTESQYYYNIFKNKYNRYNPKIEYWLPKWQNTGNIDPSATTLSIWKKDEH